VKVRLVNLITYYALPSLRQLSVIPAVDIINDSRAICSARRSIGERFVAPRRLALTCHFSRFNLSPPSRYWHLSFRLRQFRIQRGRVVSIVYVHRYERAVQTIHMQMRERQL
jgi:hypothetical protein